MIFFYPIFKMLDRLEKKKNFLFYYNLFNDIIFIMLDVSLLYFGDKVECFNYHVLNDSLLQSYMICGIVWLSVQLICVILHCLHKNHVVFLSICNYNLLAAINLVNIIQIIVYVSNNKSCIQQESQFKLMLILLGTFTLTSIIATVGVVILTLFRN